jgi:hypothetical protein
MARLDDWEARLGEYLATPGRDVFEWGTSDCALFCAGAVEALTGEHPFPDVIGTYTDAEGAAEVLRELGGTLFCTVDSAFPRKATGFAQRGDIVMAQHALGICVGGKGVFLQLDVGFVYLPRSDFQYAWEV